MTRSSVWGDAASLLGGAVASVLAFDRSYGPLAGRVAGWVGASERLEPYFGFLFVTIAALLGVGLAFSLRAGLARLGRSALTPWVLLLLVAALGLRHATWLVWAAPAFVCLGSCLTVTGRVRAVSWRTYQREAAVVCIASEAMSFGTGAWFPYAEWLPAVLLPFMIVPAAVAGYVAAARWDDATRWRAVFAGMPALLLPFFGLTRNPTLMPTAVVAMVGVACFAALGCSPTARARARHWAERHALGVALPALILVLVLPWRFRDMGTADAAGHEGQHLGWINSILFGKLMMADAGFTYGPAREYALAALAWTMGGVTLEHVRLAHVAVNVVGLLCVFAAMQRVCARQVHSLLLGLALIVTHSAIASFVVYTKTYSFGWADACRAGLPTLAVVIALTRPADALGGRAHLAAAGALAGLSVLYSHDFGVPATLAALVGIASETLVRRPGERLRVGARVALRDVAVFGAGLSAVLVPFVLFYAGRGKAVALLRGYGWTVLVSSGRTAFPGRTWAFGDAFDSVAGLSRRTDPDDTYVVARALDYVVNPALAIIGLTHAAGAIVLRRFARRTTVILALSVLVAAATHHAFLASDPWHAANAGTPALVLLLALGAGGRRLFVRVPGRRPLPLGIVAAAMLPALWFLNGGWAPINMRLSRIAAGEERPSKGEPYAFADIPRIGDLGVGSQHLDVVRYIQAHSKPDDAVFCTTWMLGGGTEAFLSQRRNPTSFDKPDEVVSKTQRDQVLAELKKDPPLLIVGGFFDYLDDETRRFIDTGWRVTMTQPGQVRERRFAPGPRNNRP